MKMAFYSSLGHSTIPDSPSFAYVSSPAPVALHGAEVGGALTSIRVQYHSTANDSSLFAADIVMLPWSHLLHHVCVSLAQPPTLMYQQPCAVVSLASSKIQ